MNRKRLLLVPIILIFCLIPLCFFKSPISTDIRMLLPHDKWIEDHLDFLRNSQIGNVIAVSIGSESHQKNDKLSQYVEILATEFAELPGVTDVFAKVDSQESVAIAAKMFKHIPQILRQEDYKIINKNISKNELKSILRQHYRDILRPGGLFRQKLIASDPLNLHKIPLEKLQHLGKDSGFKFKIKNSQLFSKDERNVLILIYTDIPVTDPEKAEKLHKKISHSIEVSLPKKGYNHLIISGHRHAIDNRQLLKHDIFITLSVAGIGFLLLFALFFRDWKALFVFIIPILGMICAIGLTLVFFKEPSAIILGLGATVIGIALDYGIHVFVAAKNTDKARLKALQDIRRPLIFSALTTLGVFWAFFFSDTPGYHQLAFASTCGVTISLLFSLECLPAILPSSRTHTAELLFLKFPEYNRHQAIRIFLIWLVIVILAGFSLNFSSFETDIRKLDGVSDELKKSEEKFKSIWGENTKAAISVKATDLEEAMLLHDKIADFAISNDVSGFQSLSQIWPAESNRKKNASFWDEYWKSSGNEALLKSNLLSAAKNYGFSEDGFKPFFNKLYQHDFNIDLAKDPIFKILSKKFINYDKNQVRVSAFFDDKPIMVEKMKSYIGNSTNIDIISPSSFGDYISNQIIKDAFQIAIIAFCLVLILAFFCLRSITKTAVAMLPVFSAILVIIPVFAVLGLKLNAVALVACIVVTGLAIDYGIFIVSACGLGERVFAKDSMTALSLSMLSTAIGSAALLFAGHPALRTVGLVISTGVVAGYLGAIFVSPALYKLLCEKAQEK